MKKVLLSLLLVVTCLFTLAPLITRAQIPGELGSWQTVSDLGIIIHAPGAVVANNHIFILGGIEGIFPPGPIKNTVLSAEINPDGTLNQWITTTPLLYARTDPSAVFHNGFIYVMGGGDQADGGYADPFPTEYAPVNPDGTVGNWTGTYPMLIARRVFDAAIYQSAIYVAGGFDEGRNPVGTIERAVIQPDGSLNSWEIAGNLPVNALPLPRMAISNGYMYLLGGDNTSAVYRAQIQADGNIGSWVSEPSLSVAGVPNPPVVAGGQIYAVSGTRGNFSNVVEHAVINVDGSLGNWQTTSPLPTGRGGVGVVAANGWIYAIGGCSSFICYSSVLRAKILGTTPPPDNRPEARAGTSLDASGFLQLDGRLSSDADNDPLSYNWQIVGEASSRTGEIVSVADLSPGTYEVELTVSDGILQSTDTMRFGAVNKRPTSTVNMIVNNVLINRQTGAFTIGGTWDMADPDFATIVTDPLSRLLFELQTGGTQTNPIYGVVGETFTPLTTLSDKIIRQ